MVRFEHIEYLLLLSAVIVPVLLFRYVLLWKKKTVKRIGDEKLIAGLIRSFSPLRYLIKFCIITGALVILIFGVANLQSATQVENTSRKGLDIMIALDVSKSMLAEDVKPSRLDEAKQLVNKLMEKMQNDRIGLVIFAGRAYMQMPLTADQIAAKLYVNNASPDAVPAQGTVINEALRLCNTAFNSKDKKYKIILLITDGEDHGENALKTAKSLSNNGVVIITVGVGTTNGSPILNPITSESKRDLQGNLIVSKLNEQELMNIANATGGIYQQLNDTDTVVDKIMKEINSMDQKTIKDNSLLNFRSFFQWFLIAALILLTGEMFISEKRKISVL